MRRGDRAGLAYAFSPGSLIDPGQLAGASGLTAAQSTEGAAGKGIALTAIPQQIVSLVPTNLLTALVQGEMLHIVIGSAILGIALLALSNEQARPLLDLLGGLQAVCMVIVKWVLRFAPIAVFGLMADISARVGLKAITGMAAYVGTVVAGLILLFCLYLLILLIMARKSPFAFLGNTRKRFCWRSRPQAARR